MKRKSRRFFTESFQLLRRLDYDLGVASDQSPGIYSIGAVSRMLGTPAATIRNWEDRYGKIVPHRSPGGHRLYSGDQVEQLRFVAEQIERGLSAADAHRLLAEGAKNPDDKIEPLDDNDTSRFQDVEDGCIGQARYGKVGNGLGSFLVLQRASELRRAVGEKAFVLLGTLTLRDVA